MHKYTMVLRSLCEWHFVITIKLELYFCFSGEDLGLAKPYSQGLCIGWYWLFTALTQLKRWLRSEINPCFLPTGQVLWRGPESAWRGHFFYLPRVILWAYARLPKVMSKMLWQPLTRAWLSTWPFCGLQNCREAQGRNSMLIFRSRRLRVSPPPFFFSCPHLNILLFTFQLLEHRHFHH